jgi:hypothetical protein
MAFVSASCRVVGLPRLVFVPEELSEAQPFISTQLAFIGRHVSGIADPFNGHIDEFRIAYVQRSDARSRPPGTHE